MDLLSSGAMSGDVAGREAVTGPRVVLDSDVLDDHAVIVDRGRVEAVLRRTQIPSDLPIRDLGPGFLAPGLIDVHTHGAGGVNFNEGSPESARKALTTLLGAGVTTVLPTLATAPIEDLERALDTVSGLADDPGLPRLPGAHLEGPYFSLAQRGAQDAAHLREPADGSPDRLLESAGSMRMMSFAPELPGAVQLTERLVDAGVVAAAGHSDCRDEDLWACQRAGLTHVVHIFSGQSTTMRTGPWRSPGLLEATLASDGLTVEMIADGRHLPPTLMRLAHRCLPGRLCLVSDSTPGAGMADGFRYRIAGMECVVENGVGVTADRSAFGGSTTLLPQMLTTTMQTLQLSLAEALAMATAVPASAAGLPDVGRIAPGAHADFVLFNDDLTVMAVARAGPWSSTDDLT